MSNDLKKINNELVYSGFKLNKIGLIAIGKPTFEQWTQCGEFLKKSNKAQHFWYGDWLNYGEAEWGEMYSQAVDETDYAYGTLANDKYVTSKVDFSRRREKLSFDHHAEVSNLEPDEQNKLLDIAEKNNIRSKEFRQVIKEYKQKKEMALQPPIEQSKFKKQVIQGDCLVELKKISDKSIDMIYVDPPYNMGKGDWDKFEPVEFLHFTEAWIKECLRVLKPKSHFFINFCSDKVSWLEDLIMTNHSGMLPASRLIWHYRNAGGKSSGKQMFSKTYEPILHYNFGNKELNFGIDWNDERFDVWTIAIPQSNFDEGHDHPTQKPVELMDRLVKFGSLEGETVLDPMAGSGTTGVAALKNNRDFILIESNTDYINLIHKRLNDIR